MSTMTVEHSHIEHVHTQRQTILDQLKEITGVEDEAVLEQALQASRTEAGKFDLAHAVNILVDENAVRYNEQTDNNVQQKLPVPKANPHTVVVVKKEKETKETGDVIDLTNDGSEKEALQRAIALSLQEQQHGMLGGQVTAEEQDISRVLEQSLAEAKAGIKRKRGEVWQDPLNPHDRKRQSDWPVGLKNVGNTCWFSAVIQSLFHLPVFQRLVLNFTPPEVSNESPLFASRGHRNLLFMQELRRLFSLMIGSQRKYVDPSKAVDILKEAFQSGSSDSQQDVSEFTHKLLEWLEDAFRSDCTSSRRHRRELSPPQREKFAAEGEDQMQQRQDKCGSNPMIDLFYGRFRSEGHNEGHLFSNEETFGQYPLQVNGFANIHESLEAATAQEIETTTRPNQETVIKSGQEHWFTKLPPVLLFELSRFQFNQQLGRPEKIHNKFDFPEVIYMDRYIEGNKNITKTKREEVKKIREQREELQTKLEKYLNYGSGSKRVPLQDVLQYALEFVESKQDNSGSLCSPQDVDMASPCSISSMTMDSPCSSPAKNAMVEVNVSTSAWKQAPSASGDRAMVSGSFPAPGHVSETELKVLQSCLKRWRMEVESDVRSLQENVNVMDNAINSMYSEPSLQQVPYRLHAVLVHEGQAASGHYWAYVYNHVGKLWLKFNDITVTDTTWDELQKESVGGYHNASAYCLMYIDCNRKDLVDDFSEKKEVDQRIDGLENLPPDMCQLVIEDNRVFQKEIEQWDQEQLRMKEEATMTADCDMLKAAKPHNAGDVMRESVLGTESCHSAECAEITSKSSLQALTNVAEICSNDGPQSALNKAIVSEQERLEKAAKDTLNSVHDHRLDHIFVFAYLLQPRVPKVILQVYLVEPFTYLKVEDENSSISLMQRTAEKYLKTLKMSPEFHSCRKLYHQYYEDYCLFRKLVTYFVAGFERYQSLRYELSLPYLVKACRLNEFLCNKYRHCKIGLNHRISLLYRRNCLLHLNKEAMSQFDSDELEVAFDGLQLMNNAVVPCMNLLNEPNAPMEDVAAAEEIRGSWCSKLGDEITSPKQEHLQELLGKLLDPSGDQEIKLRSSGPPIQRYSATELSERFAAVLAQIRETLNPAESNG